MLRIGLSLRFLALLASLGAALGAMLVFWVGGAKLLEAMFSVLLADKTDKGLIIAAVMIATDAFLFGIVLIIFAYAIAFSFFNPPDFVRAQLPAWMKMGGINEIKHTLIEVILVYLVVDFATDIAEAEGSTHISWETLVKPLSIFMIAGALRLISNKYPEMLGHSATEHAQEVSHPNDESRRTR
ncbi:MAG TPA: YqhA family protein [Azospirillum sp.]|nr:YqhA family protein [Azospirillum sp.]